ncbi:hypothetical protein B7486_16615 [cyanobacterium TDX16]|nr:hypothetical protein B7486_16615 [cyanobacterium TDX16]
MKIRATKVDWTNLDSEPKATKAPDLTRGRMTTHVNFRAVADGADGYEEWLKATGRKDCEESIRAFCDCNGRIGNEPLPKVIHG